MKSKPPTDDELRMKASKFDKMMRRALSAPPPDADKPNPPKKKKPSKK